MRSLFVTFAAFSALPVSVLASAHDGAGLAGGSPEAAASETGPIATLAEDSGVHANSWRSATRSRFRHVLEGVPGRYRLTIRATTTSPGGETVAVYPQTAAGERGSPRIGFVIATAAGASEEMFVTIPQPPAGETQGSLPIVVDIENASGREYSGEYSIELEPVG